MDFTLHKKNKFYMCSEKTNMHSSFHSNYKASDSFLSAVPQMKHYNRGIVCSCVSLSVGVSCNQQHLVSRSTLEKTCLNHQRQCFSWMRNLDSRCGRSVQKCRVGTLAQRHKNTTVNCLWLCWVMRKFRKKIPGHMSFSVNYG